MLRKENATQAARSRLEKTPTSRGGGDQACQPADASRVIHTRLVRYFPKANCEAAAEELDESKEVGQDRPRTVENDLRSSPTEKPVEHEEKEMVADAFPGARHRSLESGRWSNRRSALTGALAASGQPPPGPRNDGRRALEKNSRYVGRREGLSSAMQGGKGQRRLHRASPTARTPPHTGHTTVSGNRSTRAQWLARKSAVRAVVVWRQPASQSAPGWTIS